MRDRDVDLQAVMTSIQVADRVIRNRLVCSPISTNSSSEDGKVTPGTIDFYATMGKVGCGMVTVGAAGVSPEGISTRNCMRVGPESYESGLRELASAIRVTGAISSLQIFHVGAQGNTDYSGQPVLGPSPYVCSDIGILATELTVSQIETIEDDFVAAILSALRCGFDFVELHIAHGYLLHEFLSPHFNHRRDIYGGCEDNRLRVIRNIMVKLHDCDPTALRRIGARISGNDFLPDGLTIEKNRPLVSLFDSYGIAYWCVSAGIYKTARLKYTHMAQGEYWEYARRLKSITHTPVIAQGGIRSLYKAGEIIRTGISEMVGMAQALIADPELISKTLAGKASQVISCTECGRCRYIKRKVEWKRKKKLTFDCVRPEGYHPLAIGNSNSESETLIN